jgi:tripartite-type tricarboxylate transporter receptor subunit TctC
VQRRRLLQSAAAALAAVALPLRAQTLSRPARIIVGFPPGGTADLMGRQLAEELRGAYAPSVVVDNRPGALQAVAVQSLLSAEPDGTTLYFTPYSVTTLYPHVYRKLAYDPRADLLPVSAVCSFEFCMALPASSPATGLKEFLELAKADPKNALYGSLGHGTAFHFLGFMLSQAAAVTLTHVPFKGAAPVTQAILGAQVPSIIGPLGDMIPHHQGGKVRIVATSGLKRSQFTPDVPTFEEAGYKGVNGWERFGVYVRRDTPPAIVDAASRAVSTALQHANIKAAIEKLGYIDPRGTTPQEFERYIREDFGRWQAVVKASGFTPDT